MTFRGDITAQECGEYFFRYINLTAQDTELLAALSEGKTETVAFFENLPQELWDYRYEPGKWSCKEILLHLIDTERVFAYRALRFARSKDADLPGFDQDEFARFAHADSRDPKTLIQEYASVRNASLSLFGSLDKAALQRVGKASGNPMSARAAGFVLCGHDKHHIAVIKERYLQ